MRGGKRTHPRLFGDYAVAFLRAMKEAGATEKQMREIYPCGRQTLQRVLHWKDTYKEVDSRFIWE